MTNNNEKICADLLIAGIVVEPNTKLAGIAAGATDGASASQVTAINANTNKISCEYDGASVDD